MEERLINCMVVEDSPAKYGELIDLITADNRLTHTSKNWAKTGTQALQILRNAQANGQRIDIIFLDIHLANSENAIDHFLKTSYQENVSLPHIVLITAYRKEYGEQILEIFGERAGQDIIFRMDKENGLITPSRFNNSIDNFIQIYNFQPIVNQNYINPNYINPNNTFLQLNNRYNFEEQKWAYEKGEQNNDTFKIAYSSLICVEVNSFVRNPYKKPVEPEKELEKRDKAKYIEELAKYKEDKAKYEKAENTTYSRSGHFKYVYKQDEKLEIALTNFGDHAITNLMSNEFHDFPCFTQITSNIIVNLQHISPVTDIHQNIITAFNNIPNTGIYPNIGYIGVKIGEKYILNVNKRYKEWKALTPKHQSG